MPTIRFRLTKPFVALFTQPPFNVRVRVQLERRYVMEAWSTAVAINTAASYQSFLANYGNSDLAATARKMQERVRNRAFGAPASLAALGPMCPCPAEPAQPLKRKVEEPSRKKRVETPRVRQPKGGAVETRHQQEPGVPPEAVIQGIGIGIGIAGGLSGGGRSGGGRSPPPPHRDHPY